MGRAIHDRVDTPSMDRRNFMLGGAALAGTALSSLATVGLPVSAAGAAIAPRSYSGTDLQDWEVVVGDGIRSASGQRPVDLDDLDTLNFGTHSELRANLERRGAMVHNITYKPVVDDYAFDYHHVCSYEFRLPQQAIESSRNAQTFEGGFFIWDGIKRRDHGLGFQWVLNPAAPDYGCLHKWSNSSEGWKPVTRFLPDDQWHRIDIEFDARAGFRTAEVCFDDIHIDRTYTQRRKPDYWGNEIAARLQVEIISIDPGYGQTAPLHVAEVRNWTWDMIP